MKIVYITEQGSIIRKTSRRLVVSKEQRTLAEIPVIGIDGILIFGNVQLTSQAMSFLLDNEIHVSFLSSRGKYRGTLIPPQSKNVLLRVAQYERYLDEEFHRRHASTLVEAKIRNGQSLLKRYGRNYPDMKFDEEIQALDSALRKLEDHPPVSVLLGIEGQATAVYFRAFGQMLRGGMSFSGRSRRPPRDPVNALLSFGYTLVTNEIFSLLLAIGFDPYIGYLHEIDYGRPSLALDMVEEFRHPVVDRFTIYLINNHVLSVDDFTENEEGGFILKPDALKRYFEHYEKRMNEVFQDPRTEEKATYRSIFRQQAYKLSKTIQSGQPYTAYRLE